MKLRYFLLCLLIPFQNAYSADFGPRSDTTFGLTATVAPLSFPFPFAYGASAYFVASDNWLLEAEYLRSGMAIALFGFELGSVDERHISLQARYFPSDTGSFNFIMGGGNRNLSLKLARNLFDLATNSYSLTVSELSTNYIKLGLSNQWYWRNKYTVTFDWFSLNIPVNAEVKHSASRFAENEDDQETIKDSETVLSWYPSGAILKASIGITF